MWGGIAIRCGVLAGLSAGDEATAYPQHAPMASSTSDSAPSMKPLEALQPADTRANHKTKIETPGCIARLTAYTGLRGDLPGEAPCTVRMPGRRKGRHEMSFYRRTWYYIGGVLFVALAFVIGFQESRFGRCQLILIYSFMALLVHQFEEYALPGGFPAISNIAVLGEVEVPERYPLNANQIMITNVFLLYPFYIAAVLWPQVIWLGIAQVMLGVLQIFVHGIVINGKLKSLYNPGLASALFLHLPIAVYYIRFILANHAVSVKVFVAGSLAIVAAALVTILLPLKLLGSRDSKYPISEAEMYGFAKEKVQKMRVAGLARRM